VPQIMFTAPTSLRPRPFAWDTTIEAHHDADGQVILTSGPPTMRPFVALFPFSGPFSSGHRGTPSRPEP
jgi:hypothetical protein